MDFMGMSLHTIAFFQLYDNRKFSYTISLSAGAGKRAPVYFRNQRWSLPAGCRRQSLHIALGEKTVEIPVAVDIFGHEQRIL